MDDVFLRVLNPENNAEPLPAVAVPPDERGRMIPLNNVAIAVDRQRNPSPPPDRAERHRRRQRLIDNQRRIDLERADIEMQELENPVPVPPIPPNQIANCLAQEEVGVNPPAPAARNINVCAVCTFHFVDRLLGCGHPFCSQCITTLRNSDAPNPSLCPRCREPFMDSVRIYF